ncbi:hypothetical protein HHL17_22245 [Chitinophaga sp. G-6-1-13]|uniref:Uncharacterized protein n=1 Tax=Chitinophaga fulva TaxID=2728842 RepID=A0A848GW76_9BACT|nr:hypothetical protein [Chitinophaga fulva]NML39938.1 hypothetical protein [Chitinophaga fulva]
MDRPRIYVDFNEMIAEDLVLLSQEDTKRDSAGNLVQLFEGKTIDIFMDDTNERGEKDNLIASGTVEANTTGLFPVCKWNCRIDANGIRHERE